MQGPFVLSTYAYDIKAFLIKFLLNRETCEACSPKNEEGASERSILFVINDLNASAKVSQFESSNA